MKEMIWTDNYFDLHKSLNVIVLQGLKFSSNVPSEEDDDAVMRVAL